MSSCYRIAILLLLVLAEAFSDAQSSSSLLVEQLHGVLSDLDLPQSYEISSLLTALNAYHDNINSIYSENKNRYGNHSAGALGACQIGLLLFGSSNFFDASSEGFKNATQENWSETSWLLPTCILQPSSPAGVALAIDLIISFDAKFATRSGGHNPNSGFGSIDAPGLLLDLSKLNRLEISSDHKTVQVGPGNRWIDVYTYLDTFGISAVGTKEPGPGVGGSILGGGDPLFPALHGFACDNVQDFEVVLSNSSVTHANAHQHSDLFVALKGGASNLGIVTTFTLYTVPVHDTWYNVVTYSNLSNTDLFKALLGFQEAAEMDPAANIIFTLSGNTTVVGFLYAKHTTSPSVFSNFTDISTTGTLIPPTNGTIKQLSIAIGSLDGAGTAKRSIAGLSTLSNLEYYEATHDRYQSSATALSSQLSLILSFQVVTCTTVRQSRSHGDNSMGLELKAQNWFAMEVQWTSDAEDISSKAALVDLTSGLGTLASSRAMLLPFIYQNDAGNFQKPLEGIGQSSLALLRLASQTFDPSQVFQRLQNNGFLLSKN